MNQSFIYRKLFLASLLSLSLLTIGCDEDDDNAANGLDPQDQSSPTFTVTQPSAMDTFESGNAIPVAFTAEDAEGISEMKYEVHWAGDGHSHGKTQDAFEPWNHTSAITEGNGESAVEMQGETPVIPRGVKSGPYHIELVATDVNANQGTELFTFFIQDADNPMVTINSKLKVKGEAHDHDGHDHGDGHDHDDGAHNHGDDHDGHAHGAEEVKASAGDTLHLTGKVSQMGKDLREVHMHIRDHSDGAQVWEREMAGGSGVSEIQMDEMLMTGDWGSGEFHLTIEGKGAMDKVSTKEYHIVLE